MQQLIEHNVGLIVAWAPMFLSLIVIAAAAGVWWLGRGRRLLIPAGWARRSGSLVVLLVGVASALALLQMVGTGSPKVGVISRLNAAVGSKVPDISFRLVADDGEQRLRQYAGNVLVINHWATWCPPCLAEMPTLSRVQDAMADKGVVVITLSDEPRAEIQAFLARHPVATVNGRVERFEHFDIGGMRPMTMIVDRDGVLQRVMWGARTYAQFVESLQPYL